MIALRNRVLNWVGDVTLRTADAVSRIRPGALAQTMGEVLGLNGSQLARCRAGMARFERGHAKEQLEKPPPQKQSAAALLRVSEAWLWNRRHIRDQTPYQEPFVRRIRPDGAFDIQILSEDLLPEELKTLRTWVKRQGASSMASPSRALQALLSTPLDLSTKEGQATRTALLELGITTPLADAFLDYARQHFSPRALERVHFHYQGHALTHALSIFPTLSAFGLGHASMTRSAHTGDGLVERFIDLQLSADERVTTHQGGDQAAELEGLRQKLRQARDNGHILVVDKGGLLARHADDLTRDMMRSGQLRFVIHNQADKAALDGLDVPYWAVDLAASKLKALEGYFIGAAFGGFASHEAKQRWDAKLADVDVVVVGNGLLGHEIARAVLRERGHTQGLHIIDTDPAQLGERTKGLSTAQSILERDGQFFAVDEEGREKPWQRPERAVVIVASSGQAVDDTNFGAFARDALFLGVTSGAKGFAAELLARGKPEDRVRAAMLNRDLTGADIRDLDFENRDGRATIVAQGQALDLIWEQWCDRFALTSVGVDLAVLQAAALPGPGVWPLDEEHQRWAIDHAAELGAFRRRAIDIPKHSERRLEDLQGLARY